MLKLICLAHNLEFILVNACNNKVTIHILDVGKFPGWTIFLFEAPQGMTFWTNAKRVLKGKFILLSNTCTSCKHKG